MNLDFEKHQGFDFVKIGVAAHCPIGIEAKHKGKSFQWHASIEPIHSDFLNAEQSVYIVKVDDEIKYIGVYSDTFKSRWLKTDKYFWHSDNLDNKISALLREDCEITFWLSVNPYVSVSDENKMNVSLSLEFDLINYYNPEWNTTHKNKKLSKNRVKVQDVVNQISRAIA